MNTAISYEDLAPCIERYLRENLTINVAMASEYGPYGQPRVGVTVQLVLGEDVLSKAVASVPLLREFP